MENGEKLQEMHVPQVARLTLRSALIATFDVPDASAGDCQRSHTNLATSQTSFIHLGLASIRWPEGGGLVSTISLILQPTQGAEFGIVKISWIKKSYSN